MTRRRAALIVATLSIASLVVIALPWGVPFALWNSSRTTAWVGDDRLHVVRNPGNGMVGIDDLGSLDGMLFELTEPTHPDTANGWWMLDVPIPLEIAFFDPSHKLIEIQRMEPCAAEPCQVYRSTQSYLWVLETEVGRLHAQPGDILRIEDRPSN